MNRIDKAIKKSQDRLARLQEKKREQETKKQKPKSQPRSRTGRPSIDDSLILKAIKLAETLPLSDVALRLGLSVRTLYNKGISRRVLEARAR